MPRSIDKIPFWKKSTATLAALGAMASGGLTLSGCTSPDKPAPAATATANPGGEKTPDVVASPTANVEIDKIHDDLTGLTSEQIFPLPEELTPDYVVAHRDEIRDIFAMSPEEADTPESFIQAFFARVVSMENFCSDKQSIADTIDGNVGGVLNDREDDFRAAWQATYGMPTTAKPTPNNLKWSNIRMLAFQNTGFAIHNSQGQKPEYPTASAQIPDMDSFKYEDNGDGTWSGTIKTRNWFKVDNKFINTHQDDTVTFNPSDEILTWTFSDVGIDNDGNVTMGNVDTNANDK